MNVPFEVGDRLVRQYGQHGQRPHFYRVVGWTPRGKVRLLAEPEGHETSRWWASTAHLPSHYNLLRDADA